jgi:hypothetical protein
VSKRSRTFQPSGTPPTEPDPTAGSTPSSTSGTTGPSAAAPTPTPAKSTSGSTSRAEARRRSSAPKASAQQSFFDRYRVLIIGGAGVIVVILAVLFFGRSSTSAYECVTFLTPPPAAAPDASGAPAPSVAPATSGAPAPSSASSAAPASSPAAVPSAAPSASPAPTQLIGFPTSDLGKEHVSQGASVRYDYCPPASGKHYNLGNGLAPLARRFYGPDVAFPPQHWIHNLEHGGVVLLYKGEPSDADLEALRGVMDQAEPSDWNVANCGATAQNKVIAIRFDDMDPGVNFAAVAWDRALLQEQLDAAELLAFANQWQDGPQTPERICG